MPARNTKQPGPSQQKQLHQKLGMVAVLDALGAASYGKKETKRFIESRNRVRLLLDKRKSITRRLSGHDIKVFTFNDTILMSHRTEKRPSLGQVKVFLQVLAEFVIDSLYNGILFRGALSYGNYYEDPQSNTVMGRAVSDAAAWYDKAEWIGIHATPKMTIFIQSKQRQCSPVREMLDYDVPLKDGTTVLAKAVNWPVLLFTDGFSPCRHGEQPRKRLLDLLSKHTVPIGTENKYYNTIKFFDYAVEAMAKSGKK